MASAGVRALLAVQGSYYLVTGLWPLVSIRSFQWVTGPETDHLPTGREADHWLVNTVAVLIIAIAVALLVAAWKREYATSIIALAIAAAIGLSAIDIIYVSRQVIDPIYLLDTAAEAVLLVGWGVVLSWRRARARVAP